MTAPRPVSGLMWPVGGQVTEEHELAGAFPETEDAGSCLWGRAGTGKSTVLGVCEKHCELASCLRRRPCGRQSRRQTIPTRSWHSARLIRPRTSAQPQRRHHGGLMFLSR